MFDPMESAKSAMMNVKTGMSHIQPEAVSATAPDGPAPGRAYI